MIWQCRIAQSSLKWEKSEDSVFPINWQKFQRLEQTQVGFLSKIITAITFFHQEEYNVWVFILLNKNFN